MDFYSTSHLSNTYTPDPASLMAFISMFMLVFACTFLIIYLFAGFSYWKIFTKAGLPGWTGFVPFYNNYKLFELVGKPGWWVVLLLVPGLNIVMSIVMALELGKAFGKDTTYSILLVWLLAPLGPLMLGFGDAKYTKPEITTNLF